MPYFIAANQNLSTSATAPWTLIQCLRWESFQGHPWALALDQTLCARTDLSYP